MTREDFLQKQHEISVTAGTNQRYHQTRASDLTWWDRTCKIAVGFLAVVGACLSAVTIAIGNPWLIGLSVSTAILAALVAIALNVLPFGEWASQHLVLFQRWTDIREDVDSFSFDLSGEPTDDMVRRLKELGAKVHRICGSEPGCKTDLFLSCYDEEKKSRQFATTACAS